MSVRFSRVAIVTIAIGLLVFPAIGSAQNTPDLRRPAGKEWLTIGGDWSNSRFSTLTQINASNVKDLKGAWVTHLGSGLAMKYSLETTPIVKDGVMYLASGNDDTYAIDARTGQLIWQWASGIDQTNNAVCCGWDNRGVAVAEGKVFLGLLDGAFVALDQASGELLWKTQIETWQNGYTITAAPLYHNGVIYTGISGGERMARGRLTALDAGTGRELWRFYTVPGPNDFGGDTWPSPNDPDPRKATAYLYGGATVWNTPAIDPELGLLYFSTGNAAPNGMGGIRPGDNLFAASIVALHLDGTYAWHFQQVHHDIWDFDMPSPVLLFDQTYGGQMRKAIAQAGKTGWIYILDRTNGRPLIGIEERAVEQEPRAATAATQPYPIGDALIDQCPTPPVGLGLLSKCIFWASWDTPVFVGPGGNGGVNWANMAYNPDLGYLFATAANRPRTAVSSGSPVTVTPAIGAKFSGTYTAIDSRTNKIVWQKQMPYSIGQGSGTLATASGLLFHGEPDGNFQAYDAKSGERLWQWQTGAGADAPAITYELDGVQYVAIAVGGVSTQTTSANGDMIWAFSLNGSPAGRLQPFAAPKPPPTQIEFTAAVVTTDSVRIADYSFTPGRISVKAGTTVTWSNAGPSPHTATSGAGGFDTGELAANQTASFTFDTPGTYTYLCTPHPWMFGQVIVTP